MPALKTLRPVLRPIPCKCWNEGCANFISPYLKVRAGAVFCSPTCREVGNRLSWLFQACPRCGGKFKKKVGHRLCGACQQQLEARRVLREQRSLLAPLPRKNCAWRYCQDPFTPAVSSQKYCSRQCGLNSNAGGGKYDGVLSLTPKNPRDVLCAGGCGAWVSFYPFREPKRCYQCYLGRKYGKLNCPPVINVAEPARTLVSEKRQTNVLRPWLAGFIVGLGAWLVGAGLRAKKKSRLTA